MAERFEVRLAIAAGVAATSTVLLYSGIRIVQAILEPTPDPALVFHSAHSGYFWRAWTAAYAGGMAGFVTWIATGRDAPRTARVLGFMVGLTTVVVVLQALVFP